MAASPTFAVFTQLVDLAVAASTVMMNVQQSMSAIAKANAEGRDLSDAELQAIRDSAMAAHSDLSAKIDALAGKG